jgi:hypothetical protein
MVGHVAEGLPPAHPKAFFGTKARPPARFSSEHFQFAQHIFEYQILVPF